MYYKDELYLTEVNPIPGSMSFYLWEASGISFKDQITELIEQAIKDSTLQTSLNLEYSSDIIDKYINSKGP
jgi:D-alanine-D-alanine ligase